MCYKSEKLYEYEQFIIWIIYVEDDTNTSVYYMCYTREINNLCVRIPLMVRCTRYNIM